MCMALSRAVYDTYLLTCQSHQQGNTVHWAASAAAGQTDSRKPIRCTRLLDPCNTPF
jgi:hypothetical protein